MIGYVKRYSMEFRDNYFGMHDEDFNDGLVFTNVLSNSFTDYNEQMSSEDNEFQVVFGNFSIAFSLASSLRSENGLTVKEFFKPSDNTLYKYAISYNLGAKEIGGIMVCENTTVDKSFLGGKWDINITFISWEKEFAAYCITPANSINSPIHINNYIQNNLFRGSEGSPHRRYDFDLNFNWDVRNASDGGFEPVLVGQAYFQMLTNGISETGWQLFKELAYGAGFVFKFRTNGLDPDNNDFINVELWTGWRSEGIHHVDIKMIEPHTETNQIDASKYLMLLYGQDTASNQQNTATRFCGIMKTKDELYINDGENITAGSNPRRHFYNVNSDDFTSAGLTIDCKNMVRDLEDPTLPFPFDRTMMKAVKPVYRINYSIDKGGDTTHGNANRFFFVNDYAKVGDTYMTKTVAFWRLFVKDYTLFALPSPVLGSQYWEIRDTGWYDHLESISMAQRTAAVEYEYLIGGNKNIINTDIHFDSNTAIEIYDTTTINGVNYWLRRISNINLSFDPESGQRASTEWVQI